MENLEILYFVEKAKIHTKFNPLKRYDFVELTVFYIGTKVCKFVANILVYLSIYSCVLINICCVLINICCVLINICCVLINICCVHINICCVHINICCVRITYQYMLCSKGVKSSQI